MSLHTFSSRYFKCDVSAAMRAASDGPVFITDRSRPAYVLLKIEDYYRLSGRQERSLLDVMDGIPSGVGLTFEPEPLQMQLRDASFG